MVRMIAVNGIKVEKGLCTVAFRVWPKFKQGCLSPVCIADEGKDVTHTVMYDLLDAAIEVDEFKNQDKAANDNRVAELNMGNGIYIDMWEVKR